jgi:probable HAF family extracellular repeat protein
MSHTLLRTLFSLALTVAPGVWAVNPPEYTITEFNPLPGRTGIHLYKINEGGDIIGSASDTLYRDHPFVYRNGIMQELFGPDDTGGAVDINNNGQIVAFVTGGEFFNYLVISPDGTTVDLGDTLGEDFTAIAINDAGDILGHNSSPGSDLLYNLNTGSIRFLPAPAGNAPQFRGLNNDGKVVGDQSFENPPGAFGLFFDGTQLIQLEYPGNPYTYAFFINNRSYIAGDTVEGPIGDTTPIAAFIYHNGHFKSLGWLPGDNLSWPFGLNDDGDVVGLSGSSFGGRVRPFLYRNQKMVELNSLVPAGAGWTLTVAYHINNHGQIVGEGTLGGEHRGYLLTPAKAKTK